MTDISVGVWENTERNKKPHIYRWFQVKRVRELRSDCEKKGKLIIIVIIIGCSVLSTVSIAHSAK